MNRQEKNESTREERNGVAQDREMSSDTSTSSSTTRQEVQGYLLLLGGLIAFLFSFGYFEFLKYAVAAGGLVMMFFGAKKAHLVERTQELINKFKSKH